MGQAQGLHQRLQPGGADAVLAEQPGSLLDDTPAGLLWFRDNAWLRYLGMQVVILTPGGLPGEAAFIRPCAGPGRWSSRRRRDGRRHRTTGPRRPPSSGRGAPPGLRRAPADLVGQRAQVADPQVGGGIALAGLEPGMDRAAHAGVQQRRGVAAVHATQRIVVAAVRGALEQEAPFGPLDGNEVDQFAVGRTGQLAAADAVEELLRESAATCASSRVPLAPRRARAARSVAIQAFRRSSRPGCSMVVLLSWWERVAGKLRSSYKLCMTSEIQSLSVPLRGVSSICAGVAYAEGRGGTTEEQDDGKL